MIKDIIKYLQEFITFFGLFVLAVFVFIVINLLTDIRNPCSNFSDVQDQCEQR